MVWLCGAAVLYSSVGVRHVAIPHAASVMQLCENVTIGALVLTFVFVLKVRTFCVYKNERIYFKMYIPI